MERLADDLWLLDGRPRYVLNIYLAGDTLVDTGTRWARVRICRQVGRRRLGQVLLTHAHPDHQGSAHAVCRRYGVPLACHEADVPAVEGRVPLPPRIRFGRVLIPLIAGPPRRVDRVLRDGDEVAGFRVVHAPGHTPGHVFYFREADRIVLAGDVLANMHMVSGKPGLREPPRVFSSDPRLNRESMRKLLDLRPSLVCFGHGPPLRDLAELDRFLTRLATRRPTS